MNETTVTAIADTMRLTSFTDYTLRVLIYLGVHRDDNRLTTISDIAGAYGISKNHLVKIVHHLAKRGYVETTRGQGGGMRLARMPGEINVGDVVRGAEEDLAVVLCFEEGNTQCPIMPECALRGILSRAMQAFFEVLDRATLADLLQHEARLAKMLAQSAARQPD